MDGERRGHAIGVALQSSWHAGQTARQRVRSVPASNFRLSPVLGSSCWSCCRAWSPDPAAHAQTKTPPGEHHGGVIAARTRKGGSTFSRADLGDPLTKVTAGRSDSRLWNPKSLVVLNFRPAGAPWPQSGVPLAPENLRRRCDCRARVGGSPALSAGGGTARTRCGNSAGCPRRGSGGAHRAHPRAGR